MVDLKEERQYEQLRRLAKELHIPLPEAFLTLEVFDKDGKLIQRHHQRSHSWVRNAYNHLFTQLAGVNGDDGTFGAGKLNIKDDSGALQAGTSPIGVDWEYTVESVISSRITSACGYRGGAGVDDIGIQVGTGTNAESFEDYALQTLIVEGSGAGQLNYVEQLAPAISYAALIMKNEMARYFNNNSGGAIGVNEVALLLKAGADGSIYQGWIQSRDKLPATVNVPDTGQLKVTYTVQLTYPA
ncbi:hypothetical protein ES703_122064 [subsurface metagenome]